MASTIERPLLGTSDVDISVDEQYKNVQELIKSDPTRVLSYVKDHGLRKLGTFEVQDAQLLGALAGRSMLTYGSDAANPDYEAMWRQELNRLAPEDSQEWGARVTVAAYVVTVRHAAAPDKQGLLYPLLLRYQAGNLSSQKWQFFAYRLLLWELAVFLVWLVSFNVFVIVFQDEHVDMSLSELLATNKGKVTVAAEALALVAMSPFLLIEGSTMVAYLKGWLNAWNLLDMATYVNQVMITVLHLSRTYAKSDFLTFAVSLQCILLWFRLQYFSRVFRPTKFSFYDGLVAVFEQTKWYFVFTLLIMWGFGMAFFTLYRLDQTRTDEFDTIGSTTMTMFKWMLSGADMDVVAQSSQPGAALVLAIVYQFVMCMVLLNVLVGVMMNAVTKVDDNQDVLHYCSRAAVTDELESTLPPFMVWYTLPVMVDKEASGNIELILGEDDMAAVEEPVAEDDEEQESAGGQVEQQLAALRAELAEVKDLLLGRARV